MNIIRKNRYKTLLILFVSFLWLAENAYAEEPEKVKPKTPLPKSMVLIKGSCFNMGDAFENGHSDERPIHKVCLDDFYMGKYEVTVSAFRKFVKSAGYLTETEKKGKGWTLNSTGDSWEKRSGISWKNPGFKQGDKHPVVLVSWNDAMAYICWLNKVSGKKYRLPTEAEWEYAARDGGKLIEYAWGNKWPDGNIAGDELKKKFSKRPWPIWEDYDDSYVFTAPVGSFAPNNFGLYDMAGNVWEWNSDWYIGNYYVQTPSNNPKGPKTGTHRVRRGGSWFSMPLSVRTSVRDCGTPDERDSYLGFRLAMTP